MRIGLVQENENGKGVVATKGTGRLEIGANDDEGPK